jgi:6-phosphogluconolactonase
MELVARIHAVKGLSRVALLAVAASVAMTPAAFASNQMTYNGKTKVVGAVYTETNGLAHNAIVAFHRYSDGHLKQVQTIGTGGRGGAQQQPGCTAHCPILDTQGEVNLTPDGHLLFAVNAGSNTISAFRVTSHGLKLVDKRSSGGVFPSSLTSSGNLLYVLNANSMSIVGFRFTTTGKLTPIKRSKRSLSSGAMPGASREIGFDSTGRVLVVTLLMPSVIDAFVVKANGTPGPAIAHPSSTPLPFGFAFDPIHDHLVVSQITSVAGTGSAAAYRVTKFGGLTTSDTEADLGIAPCWVSITPDGRYAFVVNTGGPAGAAVSRFALASNGKLKRLGQSPGTTVAEHTDEVLSSDGHYLYVLGPSETPGTSSHIDEYKVGSHGSLKLIGSTSAGPAIGVSGLVGL